MTCDDSKCLPREYLDFAFDIEAAIKPVGRPNPATEAAPSADKTQEESDEDASAEKESQEENNGILDPASWEFSTTVDGGIITLNATGSIDEGWHIYSINPIEGDGPVSTELNILEGDYELVGTVSESGELHAEYDLNFMMDLEFYEESLVLSQSLKINNAKPAKG
mgnify:FL=1